MGGVMGMLPGMGKAKEQMAAAGIDDRMIKRQRAIISSMTPFERRNPKELDGKRKRRIAAGSGTKVEDVNKLIKMHRQMADMMKNVAKNPGMMAKMAGALGLGGGIGGMGGMGGPSPKELEAMQAELARLDPKALEQLPKEIRDMVPKKLPAPQPGKAPPGAASPSKGGGLLPGLGGGGSIGGRFPLLPGLGGGKPPLLPGGPQGGKKK
jgi:signal recognition particle subunit SRP54